MNSVEKTFIVAFVVLGVLFLGLELFPLQIGSVDPFSVQLFTGMFMTATGSAVTISCLDKWFPRFPTLLVPFVFLLVFFGLTFCTIYMTL